MGNSPRIANKLGHISNRITNVHDWICTVTVIQIVNGDIKIYIITNNGGFKTWQFPKYLRRLCVIHEGKVIVFFISPFSRNALLLVLQIHRALAASK